MTGFKTLDRTIRDDIAMTTFNRPDQMNRFNAGMASDLLRLPDATDANDDIGGVIITGSGRTFCARADLSPRPSTFGYASEGHTQKGFRNHGGMATPKRFGFLLKHSISLCA